MTFPGVYRFEEESQFGSEGRGNANAFDLRVSARNGSRRLGAGELGFMGSPEQSALGQRIEIVETSLKKHAGTFETVSEGTIQLRVGSADESVKKEDVMRVTSLEKSHRLRNALIGGLIGGGAGAGIGAAVHSGRGSYIPRSGAAAIGAVLGLAGGAAVGAAVPSHDTIYRAKPQ